MPCLMRPQNLLSPFWNPLDPVNAVFGNPRTPKPMPLSVCILHHLCPLPLMSHAPVWATPLALFWHSMRSPTPPTLAVI